MNGDYFYRRRPNTFERQYTRVWIFVNWNKVRKGFSQENINELSIKRMIKRTIHGIIFKKITDQSCLNFEEGIRSGNLLPSSSTKALNFKSLYTIRTENLKYNYIYTYF